MAIFKSERDRDKFLEYVGRAVKRYDIKVHTYCLMSTHYHFLIETPQANLSQAVKWINVAYSVYFNRKRRRVGHLFQGRFKSVLVEADEYLKQLSRYIYQKGKKKNLARDVAIYLCRELTGETGVALGRRFDICGSAIAIRHNQIANQLPADRKLKRQIDRIRKQIVNI